MSQSEGRRDYHYGTTGQGHAHAYLIPQLARFLDGMPVGPVFEIGCGNGAVAAWMQGRGFQVTGIDYSDKAIENARKNLPGARLDQGSAYDDLAAAYGRYPAVVSLEVVEHLFDPRRFAKVMFDLVRPGGSIFVSTPYHGYFKNFALAASGRLDAHFTALWDGGHIKFWSKKTLGQLLREAGFVDIGFHHAGRIAPFAKSMIAVARRPVE